jgi:hypothetical protein
MSTDGIEAVFLKARNWGTAARFFRDLGFTPEFETGHNSRRPDLDPPGRAREGGLTRG